VTIAGVEDDLILCLQRRYVDMFEKRTQLLLQWLWRRNKGTLEQIEQGMSCRLVWRREGTTEFIKVAEWTVRHNVRELIEHHLPDLREGARRLREAQ
jgi:hypothetical protein